MTTNQNIPKYNLDSLENTIISNNPTAKNQTTYSDRKRAKNKFCNRGKNPLCLSQNRVTIKARKCNRNIIGKKFEFRGVEYEIVSNETLRAKIQNNEDVTKVVTTLVTDMNRLFYGNRFFNQDISGWDTKKVTTMEYMFLNANFFNQDLSKWNVSNVTRCTRAFLPRI